MAESSRHRAKRPRLVLGAAAVLAAAVGAGTSQAGVEDVVDRAARGERDAVERLLEQLEDDRQGPLPGGEDACPRRLQRLGVCKPHPHGPQGDFEPFDGDEGAADRRRHAHDASAQHHSRGGGAEHAHGTTRGFTTLDRTIEGTGDPEDGFQTLRLAGGEGRIVREDLAEAEPGRAERRRSMLYAGQTTDWQITDEESPARVEFVDIAANEPFPSSVSAAWRPQEFLGPYAVEQSIRQLNEFADRSPVRDRSGRAAMDMVLMTGDQADNQHLNETRWVQRLLEGGMLDPNSGTDPSTCPVGQQPSGQTARPRLYAGVQDYDDYFESEEFYDPNVPTGPKYSDWPTYPDIVDRAQERFFAHGLDVPSYVVPGNHDGLAQGNQKAIAPFEDVGVGCMKPLVPVRDLTEAFDALDPEYLSGLLTTNSEQVMFVPPDERRQYVDKRQYKKVFQRGEQRDGHGFDRVDEDELEDSEGAASYYAWTPRRDIRLVGIDTMCEGGVTGPSSNGNIDDPQFQWLEEELERATERDQLVIVFGHHPIGSLTCAHGEPVQDEFPAPGEAGSDCTGTQDVHEHDTNPGCDLDPRPSTPLHLGDDLEELFHRFPHVIAYVAGHTHENTISQFDRPEGGPGDFWGIETASLIDWPPQNRLIELMDNCDGTLSIFGTTLDSAAPATAPESDTDSDVLTGRDMASISRTLSFNDPQAGLGSGEGEPADRNVELLLEDPRRDPTTCKRRGGGEPVVADPGGSAPAPEGSLPFTGYLLGGLLLAAGVLTAGGLVSRRLARRGSD